MIKTLVLLHILCGSGAVAGMLGALVVKKGGLWHRRMGKLFTISMALALLSALVVSVLTLNAFLGLIGLFSAYFVYTGWRVAKARDGVKNRVDQRLSQLMLLCAFAMITFGAYLGITGESLGLALAVFGIFAFQPAWFDFKSEAWPIGKERVVLHLGRMGGASIATLTAVFVVNIQTSPAFIAWLLPTLVGTPLIIYWTRRTLA